MQSVFGLPSKLETSTSSFVDSGTGNLPDSMIVAGNLPDATTTTGSMLSDTPKLSSLFSTANLLAFGSLVSSGFQVFSTMKAAQLEERVFHLRAQQQELQAEQVKIAAMSQMNEVRKRLLDNLASSDASFAARGISISSGTPLQAQMLSRRRASRDLQEILAGSKVRYVSEKARAEQSRFEGAARRRRGILATTEQLQDISSSLGILSGNITQELEKDRVKRKKR